MGNSDRDQLAKRGCGLPDAVRLQGYYVGTALMTGHPRGSRNTAISIRYPLHQEVHVVPYFWTYFLRIAHGCSAPCPSRSGLITSAAHTREVLRLKICLGTFG